MLNLEFNTIGAKGAQYLAQALINNKVKNVFLLSATCHHDILLQTLVTLDLWRNKVGDKGSPYFAQALRKNTVGNVIFYYTYSFVVDFNSDTDEA